ncbi:type III pantothenate kinase [Arachidicoccus rhizosphaerae]|uniref:Type III pantothenate kinase n=1 Tax=Arachidicoccus rhizosphaerae TaxID=551991 RepID=A0A1H3XE37_9BACT|nr:type III pantothenate kinase [Arachidicoccus rhizosphaerae]SDZ96954.1 type III pantothenate kinase [Arachidicoccus rhizosphaerae]
MAKKILCFDFGNSRLKCALMSGASVQEEHFLDGTPEQVAALLDQLKPDRTILSSVTNYDPAIDSQLEAYGHFCKIGPDTKFPIHVPSGQEKTVGADRWAMLMAARAQFAGQHNLIIGLGSCITFNFLDKFDNFLGGSISPGLMMRLKSLKDYTAGLPLIKPDWNFPLIGYDTRTNILSGVILGMAAEIDGIIDLYKAKYSKLNIIITGGDIHFFVPHLKNTLISDPHLIYKGLYQISQSVC